MYTQMSFGQALVYLNAGVPCRRAAWQLSFYPDPGGPGNFVFKQVPSEVPAAVIPKMTSLPQQVKDLVTARGLPLRYDNQFALVDLANNVSGWSPSSADALANDWEALHPFAVAGETVGTAKPSDFAKSCLGANGEAAAIRDARGNSCVNREWEVKPLGT